MPLRPIAVSILIFIFIIIGIYEVYIHVNGQNLAYQISSNHKWLGVVDLNADHGIDMAGVIKGDDALLVIDGSNPLVQQLMQDTTGLPPEEALKSFELATYDSNKDGILNQEDPIFHYLKILVFDSASNSYTERTLTEAGIRGIHIRHLQDVRKHQAILSDGSQRAVYEMNKSGGTSIYKTPANTTITDTD